MFEVVSNCCVFSESLSKLFAAVFMSHLCFCRRISSRLIFVGLLLCNKTLWEVKSIVNPKLTLLLRAILWESEDTDNNMVGIRMIVFLEIETCVHFIRDENVLSWIVFRIGDDLRQT